MGFFKKLKKLMCWRKRDKSGKKVRFAEIIEIVENSYEEVEIIEEEIAYRFEDVECNTMGLAEVETTSTGMDNNEDVEDVKTNALEVASEEERMHKGDSRFEVVAVIENVEANTVELGEQEHENMDVEVKFDEIFEQEIGNSYEDAERKFRKPYEEEIAKKTDSRYEDMEGNTPELEVEPTNIGKNNEYVVHILLQHVEELKKKLEERDGLIATLQKKLQESVSEMKEMEANSPSELVKKLEKKRQ